LCDLNPTQNPIAVKRKVGYLPEDVGFYEDLTGLENLTYTARLNSMGGQNAVRKAQEIIEKVGLAEASNKKAGNTRVECDSGLDWQMCSSKTQK
jgi:ABC-2 type transport system ATP-binding protein